MTWEQYLDLLISQGCNEHNAMNVIGRLMDFYESYDWECMLPFEP